MSHYYCQESICLKGLLQGSWGTWLTHLRNLTNYSFYGEVSRYRSLIRHQITQHTLGSSRFLSRPKWPWNLLRVCHLLLLLNCLASRQLPPVILRRLSCRRITLSILNPIASFKKIIFLLVHSIGDWRQSCIEIGTLEYYHLHIYYHSRFHWVVQLCEAFRSVCWWGQFWTLWALCSFLRSPSVTKSYYFYAHRFQHGMSSAFHEANLTRCLRALLVATTVFYLSDFFRIPFT